MSFPKFRIFKLQKNGWHYEKTNVIFGLNAPKNIKKHQKIKIKKTRPKICCPMRVISSGNLYCCLLPQCEALRTCRSGFPVATKWLILTHTFRVQVLKYCGKIIFYVKKQERAERIKCKQKMPKTLQQIKAWVVYKRCHQTIVGNRSCWSLVHPIRLFFFVVGCSHSNGQGQNACSIGLTSIWF